MIAVTCTNGKRFAVDPDHIERIESRPDTAVFTVDGAHYVVDETLDQVLLAMRDHHARRLVKAQRREGRAPGSPRPGAPAGEDRSPHPGACSLVTRGHCQIVL